MDNINFGICKKLIDQGHRLGYHPKTVLSAFESVTKQPYWSGQLELQEPEYPPSELENMWNIQTDFYKKVFHPDGQRLSDPEIIGNLLLHLHEECNELAAAHGGVWKLHRQKDPHKRSSVLIEMVDCFKILISIGITSGIDAKTFYETFLEKSEVVEHRFIQGERLKEIEDEPKVVLDLDGVLCRYPEHFIEHINGLLGEEYSVSMLSSPGSLWASINMCPAEYERAKHSYRDSRGFSRIPPITGSLEFVRAIKELGYKIIILTSRDKKSWECMELDTYRWIKNHGFPVDIILFSAPLTKSQVIGKLKNVKYIVEDDLSEISDIGQLGIQTFLFKRPYNPDGSTYQEILDQIGHPDDDNPI